MVAALLRVLALAAAACAAPSAGTESAPPLTPPCAWPFQIRADLINVFFPDSAAAYWVLPFTVQDDLRIVLSGTYPVSRYASFNVYKEGGRTFTANGVGSSLADYLIKPDKGSVNPWRRAWRRARRRPGRFTITLRPDVAPGQVNTLPLAPPGTPEGSRAWIIFRVYLPDDGDFAKVALPAITFERGGISRPVPPCSALASAGTPLSRDVDALTSMGGTRSDELRIDAQARAKSGEIRFVRPINEETVGGFPNNDSAYVGAFVTPPGAGDVVVIRGKAPRAPSGNHPSRWPRRRKDVRYWTMCTYTFLSLSADGRLSLTFPLVVNHLPGGEIDYGCRHDDRTALDADGFYTYVIGTESQRAEIERIRGVTFLPFSLTLPTAPHPVYFRNMVPSKDFPESIDHVPIDGNPDSTAAVMGPYYPRGVVCSLATLARDGPQACFAARR